MTKSDENHTPKNVLVTGGCGFIGSNFINYIFQKWPDARIINLDKLALGSSPERILECYRKNERYSFVKGNLMDQSLLFNLLLKNRIDTVIHFAAITHVDESYANPIGTMQENIIATTKLLEAINDYGQLRRIVHISTDEVYGDCINDLKPKNEESPFDPTNPYSASKAACEMIIRSYFHSFKLPYVTVRMNNVYGPRQYHTKLIPKFVRQAIQGKPFTLMGDGTPARSWMFVDDCAEAIRRITEHGKLGQVYNIGTDFEIQNIHLAEKIHQNLYALMAMESPKMELRYIPDRPHNDLRYWLDCSKIRKELGWTCSTKFDDGLKLTVAYYIAEFKKEKLKENEAICNEQMQVGKFKCSTEAEEVRENGGEQSNGIKIPTYS